MTYGAGGSTRERTLNAVLDLCKAGHAAAPHISCIGSSRTSIREIARGVQEPRHPASRRAARRSAVGHRVGGGVSLRERARRVHTQEFGKQFFIEVAAYPEYHPQARNAQEDLNDFRRKVEAGADSAITQYFFNADAYFHFVDECEAMRLDIPIVPGIMPIGRFSQLARFSDACGAEIPRWIRKKLEGYGDDSLDPCVRARRGDRPLRSPAPERRARPALLHAQPGRAHLDDLAAPRVVAKRRSARPEPKASAVPKPPPFGAAPSSSPARLSHA